MSTPKISGKNIQIISAEAWVNVQPIQPTPGGILHVHLDYNSNEHARHSLRKVHPQGINPAILMLELAHGNDLIFITNPRHASYSEGLSDPGQYTSIDILHNGESIGIIDTIPVVQ